MFGISEALFSVCHENRDREVVVFGRGDCAARLVFVLRRGGRLVAEIRNAYRTPEEINEGAETHPAKRLLKLFPDYHKATVGPILAERIGLEKMRAACPHFDGWISKLEALQSARQP